MSYRLRIFTDPDLGTVAAAVGDDGQILVTAASYIKDGVYIALDEASVYEATGELLPLPLWDRAIEDDQP